jgi:hypothetical protein
MKKIFLMAVLTPAVWVISGGIFKMLNLWAQEPGHKAYVASVIEKRYAGDGSLGITLYRLHAVRSDGSQVDVFRHELPDGEMVMGRKIFDVASKRELRVEPATGSVIRVPMSQEELDRLLARDENCGAEPDAERKRIMGYEAVRFQHHSDLPDGQVVRNEQWRAPALGCLALRETASLGLPLGPTAQNVHEVVSVLEAEPPASLFEVSSSYADRVPSEVDRLFRKLFPGHGIFADGGARDDEIYHKKKNGDYAR